MDKVLNKYFLSGFTVEKLLEARGFRKESRDVLKHINIVKEVLLVVLKHINVDQPL